MGNEDYKTIGKDLGKIYHLVIALQANYKAREKAAEQTSEKKISADHPLLNLKIPPQ